MKNTGLHTVSRPALVFFLIIFTGVIVVQQLLPVSAGTLTHPGPAPAFTHVAESDWINSTPLRLTDLKGKVLLIDFWTFDCWNCYRSFPWLQSMEAKLAADGFQVIGVHTPEFDHEKLRRNIVAKVEQFGLRHPVMIDNDYSYWKAMGNRYWPAYYLIDKAGRVRAVFYGETHTGDRQAVRVEKLVRKLLEEPV